MGRENFRFLDVHRANFNAKRRKIFTVTVWFGSKALDIEEQFNTWKQKYVSDITWSYPITRTNHPRWATLMRASGGALAQLPMLYLNILDEETYPFKLIYGVSAKVRDEVYTSSYGEVRGSPHFPPFTTLYIAPVCVRRRHHKNDEFIVDSYLPEYPDRVRVFGQLADSDRYFDIIMHTRRLNNFKFTQIHHPALYYMFTSRAAILDKNDTQWFLRSIENGPLKP